MFIATSNAPNQKKRLILGLSETNILKLRNDMPIHRTLGGPDSPVQIPGLEDWEVLIIGPEDSIRFMIQTGVSEDQIAEFQK
jgi:hypothetical protein